VYVTSLAVVTLRCMNMLTPAATAEKIGICVATLRNLRQRGQFISPVQVAPRRVAFVESEIDAWLATRPRGPLQSPRASLSPTQTAKEL
jgi:predicted DNA-binding transcriptional regulator AlpA